MNNSQRINQDSGSKEWYTPQHIMDLVKEMFITIDLDPFSCEYANRMVQARHYYTKDDDGLVKPWFGNVWMNHPYSKKLNPLCVNKMISEYQSGNINQALMICFASTSERWFFPLLEYPQCFIRGRVKYNESTGLKNSPPKGSVITYFGDDVELFKDTFSSIGHVK